MCKYHTHGNEKSHIDGIIESHAVWRCGQGCNYFCPEELGKPTERNWHRKVCLFFFFLDKEEFG